MISSIRNFWSRLEGPVHPDDLPFFDRARGRHTFNCDFPPPAFIGDVDNASVIILMASGGYSDKTKLEFPTANDHTDYVNWLAGRRKEIPTNLSKYYLDKKNFAWIEKGEVAIVNAIAYRSPKISEEPANRALGISLPSYKTHLNWLNDELIPLAQNDERLVVAHRFGLWNLNRHNLPRKNFILSTNPASPYLSHAVTDHIRSWIAARA